MDGLIMNYQLTLPAMLRRAEQLFPGREIVTRLPDRSFHRYTYRDFARRTRQLAVALQKEGMRPGDRVATLCWNHYQHLEVYFGAPIAGGVVHTLNLRLHPTDLSYIANHARDRFLVVDESLLPIFEGFEETAPFERVIVVGDEYEELLSTAGADEYEEPELAETDAAVMCYTSGTTGKPKGVLYTHRAIWLHSLVSGMAGALTLQEADVTLPVVPMFHANAWGFPFTCTLVGAKQCFPGPHLDPASLLEMLEQEQVTVTAGVPTIWLGILQLLDADPGKHDLSRIRSMIVGGSAAPRSMIEGFQERHGLHVCHAWGMTEMCPLGTVAEPTSEIRALPMDEQYAFRAQQGLPTPLVEIRARDEEGLVPWDGKAMGELEVRGPWIASSYFGAPEESEGRWTDDGWFKTGDIVTIDERGCIQVQDRTKDVIKSGGEWISSVALENALMGHPAVAEAAVIAVPDEKWQERPLAVVVLKEGQDASPDELRAFLGDQFAKWWLPERFEFVAEIPKTAVGKFRKTALREQFLPESSPTT